MRSKEDKANNRERRDDHGCVCYPFTLTIFATYEILWQSWTVMENHDTRSTLNLYIQFIHMF